MRKRRRRERRWGGERRRRRTWQVLYITSWDSICDICIMTVGWEDHSLCGLMVELNPGQESWGQCKRGRSWSCAQALGSAWPDWSSASVIYKPDQVSYTRQIFVLPYVVCDNETKLFTATVTLEGIVLSERSQGKSPYWSENTIQLEECLPSSTKSWLLPPALHKTEHSGTHLWSSHLGGRHKEDQKPSSSSDA